MSKIWMCWEKCFSALNYWKGGGRGEIKQKLWVRGEGETNDGGGGCSSDNNADDDRNRGRRRKTQTGLRVTFLKRIERKRKWEKSEGKNRKSNKTKESMKRDKKGQIVKRTCRVLQIRNPKEWEANWRGRNRK